MKMVKEKDSKFPPKNPTPHYVNLRKVSRLVESIALHNFDLSRQNAPGHVTRIGDTYIEAIGFWVETISKSAGAELPVYVAAKLTDERENEVAEAVLYWTGGELTLERHRALRFQSLESAETECLAAIGKTGVALDVLLEMKGGHDEKGQREREPEPANKGT